MLWPENQEAWDLYRDFVNTRFAKDFGLEIIFDFLGLKKTRHEARAMLKKFIALHKVITGKKAANCGE